MRLRDKLAFVNTQLELRAEQCRDGEAFVLALLKHKKFTYRQRRALKTLSAMLHVKTLPEYLDETIKKFMVPQIHELLNRPSPLFKAVSRGR